jgi:hypothetical protein
MTVQNSGWGKFCKGHVENYSNITHLCCELIINVSNFGYNKILFYHILIYISDVVSDLILELWMPISIMKTDVY